MRCAAIDEVLRSAVEAGDVPGVVAAVSDARGLVYEGAFGVTAAGTGAAMRPDAVFRIASMTKLVTSVAVAMLCEEGKVGLDDRLERHLPGYVQPPVLTRFDARTGAYETRPGAAPVTLRQLLAHTSGYGYWFLSKELLAAAGQNAYFEAPFLLHDPGASFTYGSGTDVLGQIFVPVTGLALEQFFAERIFGPLSMSSTSFALPADPERLVALHTRRDGTFVDQPNETRAEPPRGGGGLYSTAGDYSSLLRLLLNAGLLADGRRLIAADSLAQITRNQIGELFAAWQRTAAPQRTLDFAILDGTQKFGLGVAIETRDRRGGRTAGSYGWGGIVNTYFWVDPSVGLAAVLLMQTSPFCDAGCLRVYGRFERAVYAALA